MAGGGAAGKKKEIGKSRVVATGKDEMGTGGEGSKASGREKEANTDSFVWAVFGESPPDGVVWELPPDGEAPAIWQSGRPMHRLLRPVPLPQHDDRSCRPPANGGTDRISNLQLLCNACNSMKGTGTQEELIVGLIQDGIRTG